MLLTLCTTFALSLFSLSEKNIFKKQPHKEKAIDSLSNKNKNKNRLCDKYARFFGFDLLARRVDRRSFRGVGFGNDEYDEYEEYEY